VSSVVQEVLDGLARVPTGVLADVLSEMGFRQQVVTQALRPVVGTPRFVGSAVCVAGREDHDAKLTLGPLPTMFDVDELVAPGTVVVVDAGDHRHGAVIGGPVGLAFKRAGAIGFITDGGVRDVDELAEMGLPCITRFVTPGSVKGRWSVIAVDQPVTLPAQGGGKVTIAPGDIVSADADGVVVIPSALGADVLSDALQVEKAEAAILMAIKQGHDRREAFRANDRFGHIRKRT
jgi:4-hydroxy-4-methyl-2-oxoglutarate aldolase